MPLIREIDDSRYQFDVIRFVLDKRGIKFSKAMAAKIVGGEYRLEKLVREGKIRMHKPTAKQNGKWFCNAGDVLKHIRP